MAGRDGSDPNWYDGGREDFADLVPERLTEGPLDDEPKKGRSLLIAAVLIGVGIAGGAGVFLFNQSGSSDGDITPPIIPADKSAYKVRPADPGGMQVPNQDKLVYGRIDPEAAAGDNVEKLLPEPEEPMTPPVSLPAETTLQTAAPQVPTVAAADKTAAAPPAPVAEPAVPPPPPTAEAPKDAPAQTGAAPAGTAEKEPAADAPATPEPPKTAAKDEPAAAPKPAADVAPEQTAQATTGPYMIQLAALRDQAAAEKTWAKLQGAHPDLLGPLSLVVQKAEVSGKGTFYRVRAKGLPSEKAARDLCDKLAQEKVGCLFVGK